jgi:prevent-host-death family protein
MREVALYEAKNSLSALIDEVEESGQEVVITRHGKPAARLAPVKREWTPEARAAWGAELRALREELARKRPASLTPMSWEELKTDMDEDR